MLSSQSGSPGGVVSRSIFLAGPTAVGKSEVGLALAERVGGEILSVDSMQVYRGLDIGTAKPSQAERARVPHHLIDVCELTESFSAARFVELALMAASEILTRGRVPIFCGGTGLYFKALLEGVGQAPGFDPELRAELERTPVSALLSELLQRDPETYGRIDRKNPRRIVRAIEAIRLSGKPFSAQRASWKAGSDCTCNQTNIIGFTRLSGDLHKRIHHRVEEMFQNGLVEETRQLLENGLADNRTAMQALGYRQVVEHIKGERSLEATIELVKIRTRQFAKRQMTWFRRQMRVDWMELAQDSKPDEVALQLARALNR